MAREFQVRTGMTCFTVSHNLNLAAKYATKVIVLQRPGKIYAVGAPKDFITEEMIRDVYNVECEIGDDMALCMSCSRAFLEVPRVMSVFGLNSLPGTDVLGFV